jgi:hypothetical protein
MGNRREGGPKKPPKKKVADVGYCRPPAQYQFKPGQSGNPKGRPRGARDRKTIVQKVCNEMHWIVENGVRMRRSTFELVLRGLRDHMAKGDMRAVRCSEDLLSKYCASEVPTPGAGYLVVPGMATPEEWLKEYGSLKPVLRPSHKPKKGDE